MAQKRKRDSQEEEAGKPFFYALNYYMPVLRPYSPVKGLFYLPMFLYMNLKKTQ